jgi:hypothetical protein
LLCDDLEEKEALLEALMEKQDEPVQDESGINAIN